MTGIINGPCDAVEDEEMDPLAGSSWSEPGTVAGFTQSPPNDTLLRYAAGLASGRALRVLDIGCGAGRNAVPLARAGANVIGTDLSWPMLEAASRRAAGAPLYLALAPMDALPVGDRTRDLIIAHGIWNLARSSSEFRRAIREAARVAAPAARLFVFTFSRRTLPASAQPVNGESFVFSQFAGHPQVFLTREQLIGELAATGFVPDPDLPLRELNVPPQNQVRIGGPPVIFEGGFQFSRGFGA
jgi:SAM-dependent methyltransferase